MTLLKKAGIILFYLALMYAAMNLSYVYHDHSRAKPVQENNLPGTFPLMLTWHDGGAEHCQAFFADEIAKVRKIYPSASFAVPDPRTCESAVRYFEQNHGLWPVQFEWQSRANWPHSTFSCTRSSDGETNVALTYNRDDDDSYNKSRYHIREGKILEAEHITGYGPAMAAFAVISSMGIVLGVLAVHVLYRYFKRRRRDSSHETTR